jgi:hypothetical protein
MASFAETKDGLGVIAARVRTNVRRVAQGKTEMTAVLADLVQMETDYSALIANIDAAAAASPSDPALINAKAEKGLLVAEFLATKAKAQAVIAAFES